MLHVKKSSIDSTQLLVTDLKLEVFVLWRRNLFHGTSWDTFAQREELRSYATQKHAYHSLK